jgi:hypothetical protein
MSNDEPKIFVDEDWKGKIEREREEARIAAESAPKEEIESEEEASNEASFESLVSGLAIQTLSALGAMAPPDAKEVMVDLPNAQYMIDLLLVLRDKTNGNLTPKEQGLLSETIAELQQGFVMRSQQLPESTLNQAGLTPPVFE